MPEPGAPTITCVLQNNFTKFQPKAYVALTKARKNCNTIDRLRGRPRAGTGREVALAVRVEEPSRICWGLVEYAPGACTELRIGKERVVTRLKAAGKGCTRALLAEMRR